MPKALMIPYVRPMVQSSDGIDLPINANRQDRESRTAISGSYGSWEIYGLVEFIGQECHSWFTYQKKVVGYPVVDRKAGGPAYIESHVLHLVKPPHRNFTGR